MIKPFRISRSQERMLRAIHEHGDPLHGLEGSAEHGAAVQTRISLIRRGMTERERIARAHFEKERAAMLDVMRAQHGYLSFRSRAHPWLRGLERHGGATMMERAFEGFMALPEPGNASHRRQWWQALGYSDPEGLTYTECRERYRELARERHPDSGGTHEQMAELNAAIEEARRVLG